LTGTTSTPSVPRRPHGLLGAACFTNSFRVPLYQARSLQCCCGVRKGIPLG
jgi:hypothetical protein